MTLPNNMAKQRGQQIINLKTPMKKAAKAKQKKPASPKRNGRSDELIHGQIYAAITSHKLAPGTALQEDALARAFKVSRTVVRKALQRLAHERLVDLVPNRGASVARPTAQESRAVFEARRLIERILIERAVETSDDAGVEKLIELANSELASQKKGTKQKRLQLSGDFHRQLGALSGNAVINEFLNELISRTSLIIALYESAGAVPCSHSEHLEIAMALKRRDKRKAAQYMDHHLQHIEAQIELTDEPAMVAFNSLFKPV
jgi:DNA-binding GntR family transcriptional regulator